MKSSLLTRYLATVGLALAAFVSNASADDAGVLFTMDNASAGNHVLVISRTGGALSVTHTYDTGGLGLGTANGLPSQGAVLLSPDSHWLFVCNPGSDEISVFETRPGGGLELTDKIASGGHQPVSLTLKGNLLYVLNAGGAAATPDNITAFHFGCGNLTMLSGSSRALSADKTTPTQVSFSRGGDALVVTERDTSVIDTWVVDHDGMATDHQMFASIGIWPFGFAVGRGDRLFVSEAAQGAPDGSSVSSYQLSDMAGLSVISGAVPTEQTAACWLVVTFDERYAYAADAGSQALTGFRVHHDGSLERLDASGLTAATGAHPADMAFSHDGRLLFCLNNGDGTISAFKVKSNGALESLTGLTGLPTTAAGLAAW